MQSEVIRYELEGLGDEGTIPVPELVLTEGLGERVRAEIVVGTDRVPAFEPMLDAVQLRARGALTRHWTLCLSSVRYLGFHDGAHRTRLRFEDPLLPLRHRTNTRKFRGLPAEKIIASILSDHAIESDVRVASTMQRDYCVQYRETDLDFITRLAAFEGFHWFFTPDGVFSLRDDSRASPRLRDGAVFPLVESSGSLDQGLPSIWALRRGARMTIDGVTLADHDWQKPDVLLREVATAQRDAHLELYDYPAGFRDGARGVQLAQLRAEALRSEARYLHGSSSAVDIRPGGVVSLDPALPNAFGVEWTVVRMRHHYVADRIYENSFDAVPVFQHWRMPPPARGPRIAGHHTAFVRGAAGEEIHTDKFGRFSAQMHWDREAVGTDEDSRWLRWLQETSSSMQLARVGWEVYLAFIDGDPDRPIGVGRAIDGGAPPTYGLPGNKTKMSVWTPTSPATGGYNEVSMDDAAGAEVLHVRAERDWEGVVKNDRDELIKRDESRSIGAEQKITIEGHRKTTIGHDDDATYGATSERDVTVDRSVTIGGNESVKIGNGLDDTVSAQESEKVGAVRASLVGSLQMPDWKAMAKKALEGLIPAPVTQVQALLKDPGKAFESFLGGTFTTAANAAGGAMVEGGSMTDAFGGSVQTSVRNTLGGFVGGGGGGKEGEGGEGGEGKGEGAAGGWLPSLEGLQQQYSAAGIQQQLTGALSTATGGISDLFKGDGQGDRSGVKFGWAEAEKLVDLFSIGGIEKNASASARRMVGGAQIQAAIKPVEWSSSGLYTETVGGLKLTKATADVTQEVRGIMKLTVLGPVLRSGTVAIEHEVGLTDTLQVIAAVSLDAKTELTFKSDGPLLFKAGDEISIDAGEGKSTMKLTKGGIALATDKLDVTADGNVVIRHQNVGLTTGG